MATKILFQETPFGFNTIQLGSLTVYTGKVRIKGIQYTGNTPNISVKYNKGYCIISFEVLNKELANKLYNEIGRICKEVAQSKLEQKWRWLNA